MGIRQGVVKTGVSGGYKARGGKDWSVRWVQAKECQVGTSQGVSGGYKARGGKGKIAW